MIAVSMFIPKKPKFVQTSLGNVRFLGFTRDAKPLGFTPSLGMVVMDVDSIRSAYVSIAQFVDETYFLANVYYDERLLGSR
jgi:hypothetical protein